MTKPHYFLILLLGLVALTGCEVPAADGTVEITIQNLSQRDLDTEAGILSALVGVSGGACAEGPCSPNPCSDNAQGKTQCLGMGDSSMCLCPAGTHEDPETMNCVPDEMCQATTCNNRGQCMQDDATMPPTLTCMCQEGYTGPNCTQCDAEANYFPDGLGGCSQMAEVCRDGQGTAAFQSIITAAEEELGRTPSELELTGARLETADVTATPGRNWQYLWNEEITLFMQSVSGFPHNAGVVAVPPEDAGWEPLEFDITVDRPTLSRDQQFLDGAFRVGVRGPTELKATEEFSADLKLTLDFAAY
jgi:hypothetical protein